MSKIRITTGKYNTSNFKVVKEYKIKGKAIKFLKSIGYAYDHLMNFNWTNNGQQFRLSIN